MKRNWELDELIEYFTFMPKEYKAIGNKTGETRLGFSVMFKFFQNELRFPYHKNEVPKAVVEYIAKQLNSEPSLYINYDWSSRSATYHRSQIREYFGFREFSINDIDILKKWLNEYVLIYDHDIDYVRDKAFYHLRESKVEPPTQEHLERIIQSAINSYEERFFNDTFNNIHPQALGKIDSLIDSIAIKDIGEDDISSDIDDSITFTILKSEPGSISVKSVFEEVAKLRAMNELNLPDDLFQNVSRKILKNTNTEYKYKVQTIIKASYENHYKRMVPEILDVLEFKSNNTTHYPVTRALELIKKYADSSIRYYTSNDRIPVEGVIKPSMEEIIMEKDSKGYDRINNTLMIQQVLSEKKWLNLMTPEDFRGLTPLIYAHVNPYGSFKLNMDERLIIGGDEI